MKSMHRWITLSVVATVNWATAMGCTGGSGVPSAAGPVPPVDAPALSQENLIVNVGGTLGIVFPVLSSVGGAQTKSAGKSTPLVVTSTISYDKFVAGLGLTDKSPAFEVYGITPYGETVIGTNDAVFLWEPGKDKPVKILNKLAYQDKPGVKSYAYFKDKDALLFTIPGQGLLMRGMDGKTTVVNPNLSGGLVQGEWLTFSTLPVVVTTNKLNALDRQSLQDTALPFGLTKNMVSPTGWLQYMGWAGGGDFFSGYPEAEKPVTLFSPDGKKSWTLNNVVGLDGYADFSLTARYFEDGSVLVYPGPGGLYVLDVSQSGTSPQFLATPASGKIIAKGKFSASGATEYLVVSVGGIVFSVDVATGATTNMGTIPGGVIAFNDSSHRMLTHSVVNSKDQVNLIDTTTWKVLDSKKVYYHYVKNYSGGPLSWPHYLIAGEPVDGKITVGLLGGNEGFGLGADKITPKELGTIPDVASVLYNIKVFSMKDTGAKRVTPVVPDASPDAPPLACTQKCDGKQCGDDGCGGECGVCGASQQCNEDWKCGAIQLPVVAQSGPVISGISNGLTLAVPSNATKIFKTPLSITSDVGLKAVSMECGDGKMEGVPALNLLGDKKKYEFKIQLSGMTSGSVCMLIATDVTGQSSQISLPVIIGSGGLFE